MKDHSSTGFQRTTSVTPIQGERLRLRPISGGELHTVHSRHLIWVASGWELGQRAHLRQTDLHGADLRNATLQDADLSGANLHRADLGGADLRGADLTGADLTGADLEHTDLTEADLSGAVLTRAKGLTQAQVDGAFCDASTVIPFGLKLREALKKAN